MEHTNSSVLTGCNEIKIYHHRNIFDVFIVFGGLCKGQCSAIAHFIVHSNSNHFPDPKPFPFPHAHEYANLCADANSNATA